MSSRIFPWAYGHIHVALVFFPPFLGVLFRISCFLLKQTTFLFRNVYSRIKADIFMGIVLAVAVAKLPPTPPSITISLHKHSKTVARRRKKKKLKAFTDPE